LCVFVFNSFKHFYCIVYIYNIVLKVHYTILTNRKFLYENKKKKKIMINYLLRWFIFIMKSKGILTEYINKYLLYWIIRTSGVYKEDLVCFNPLPPLIIENHHLLRCETVLKKLITPYIVKFKLKKIDYTSRFDVKRRHKNCSPTTENIFYVRHWSELTLHRCHLYKYYGLENYIID